MRSLIAFAVAILLTAPAQARPYDEIMAEAREAFTAENFAKAADLLDEAQADRPYSLYLTRNRVLARILSDRMDEAITIAKDVADRGLVLETPPNEAFDRMRADPAFAAVAAQMAENAKPVGASAIVLEIDRDFLLPEAVSYKKIGDLEYYFVGAVRYGGIHVREALHAETTGGVYGIKNADDLIWTVESTAPPFAGKPPRDKGVGIYAYGIGDGKMRCAIEFDQKDALLGSIEMTPMGLVASDSLTPRLFAVEGCDARPRVLAQDPRFVNLQGVAYDARRKKLYVADYLAGLFAIDIKSGLVAVVANKAGAHLGGIDGLYLYRGDLIGVQNGTSPQRIIRLRLDHAGKTAKHLEVLQQNLPEWSEPTNGVIVGDKLVYIATSNWPAYDDKGNLREGATLAPLRLMSVPLN